MDISTGATPDDAGIASNSRAAFRLPAWTLALFLMASCRTVPALPPADFAEPGWVIRRGQAVWRSHRQAPEIAGELLLATHASGRTVVEFTKTPLPILVAQTGSNEWQLNLVVENRTFSGRWPAPARATWVHLAVCLDGAAPPAGLTFLRLADGRWRLENSRSGESIEGYLGSVP